MAPTITAPRASPASSRGVVIDHDTADRLHQLQAKLERRHGTRFTMAQLVRYAMLMLPPDDLITYEMPRTASTS